MKRILWILTLTAALLLSACGAGNTALPEQTVTPIAAHEEETGKTEPENERSTLHALIVDGAETGKLVLADRNGAGVYLLDAAKVSVTLDGKAADASALEDGMVVEIVYEGYLLMTMPAELTGAAISVAAWSLGTEQNPGGTAYDLCGLYLQVLNDLWDKDAGLNDGAEVVSVDLSAAPGGLSESEKYAVAWIFAQSHGVQALTLTYDELIESGSLTAVPETTGLYQWDNGVLFRIRAAEGTENETYSLPVVKFNADKWRSPLGAYMLCDCSAVWPEMGTWSGYTVGAEAIA